MIIGSLILIVIALALIPSWTAWLVMIPAMALAGYWTTNELAQSLPRAKRSVERKDSKVRRQRQASTSGRLPRSGKALSASSRRSD